MSNVVVHEIACLRAECNPKAAVGYLKKHESELDDETRLPALIQCVYAAIDAGLETDARELETLIVAIDPNVPSAKRYLERG